MYGSLDVHAGASNIKINDNKNNFQVFSIIEHQQLN